MTLLPFDLYDGLVDDEPPFVGRAALLVGAASVGVGILSMAALIAAGTWLRGRLHR